MILNRVIQAGTRGSQPSPGIAYPDAPEGVLYMVTDEGNILERSNGTTWDAIAGAGSTAGKVYATVTVGASNAVDTNSSHYDYFCDGADDQIQINSAISVAAGGGRVLLSEGTFTFGAQATITVNSICIQGQGIGTKVIFADSVNSVIPLFQVGDGATAYFGIQLRDMALDGNKANQSTGGDGILVKNLVREFTADHLRIENAYRHGIAQLTAIISNEKSRITNNTILSPGQVGISWAGDNSLIDGNICKSTGHDGIFVDANDHTVVTRNIIVEPGHYGIVANSGPILVDGNTVLLNNSGSARGIHARGTSQVLNNNIRTGTSSAAAVVGIYMQGNSYRAITGNLIYFKVPNAGNIGIGAYATQCVVSANSVQQEDFDPAHTTEIGIDATSGADLSITGNTVYQWNTAIKATSAIDVTITGNNILFCSSYGINCTNASQLGIIGNAFESFTDNAIFSSPAAGTTDLLTISGNQVYTAEKDAFFLGSVQNSTITGNTFKDVCLGSNNTYAAIYLKTSNGTNRAKNNSVTGNVSKSGLSNKPKYIVREDSTNDGPNTVVANVAANYVTTGISIQHASSLSTSNLEV